MSRVSTMTFMIRMVYISSSHCSVIYMRDRLGWVRNRLFCTENYACIVWSYSSFFFFGFGMDFDAGLCVLVVAFFQVFYEDGRTGMTASWRRHPTAPCRAPRRRRPGLAVNASSRLHPLLPVSAMETTSSQVFCI